MATEKENLIKAYRSGASTITIDGHTITLRSAEEMRELIADLEREDLTNIVNGKVRPNDHVAIDLSGF